MMFFYFRLSKYLSKVNETFESVLSLSLLLVVILVLVRIVLTLEWVSCACVLRGKRIVERRATAKTARLSGSTERVIVCLGRIPSKVI